MCAIHRREIIDEVLVSLRRNISGLQVMMNVMLIRIRPTTVSEGTIVFSCDGGTPSAPLSRSSDGGI